MQKKKTNTIDIKQRNNNFNTTTTNDEEEKNFKRKAAFLSNTFQDFASKREKPPELSYFSNFQGFFDSSFRFSGDVLPYLPILFPADDREGDQRDYACDGPGDRIDIH